MARQYRLISSDGHLEVPPERWRERVPKQYRDRAPRTVRLPNGGDALMLEGLSPLEANFLDLRAGRANGQWQPFGLRVEDAAGTGPAEQRVREQDEDGIDAEVLFPAMLAGPAIWRRIKDDKLYRAVIRAYNDWLAEEYCSVAPDRLIGIGAIPQTNTADAIGELEHCAQIGLRGVVLANFPSGNDYPSAEDDRFWAAALHAGIGVTVHTRLNPLAGVAGGSQPQRLFVYPREDPEIMRKMRRGFIEWITMFGLPPAVSIAQLMLSGVFDRFPALKVFFAETRLGWVPFWLESCDLWYRRHIGWAQEYLGLQPLARPPSEYVREHIYFSVQYERVAVELRRHIGVGKIMFATDFPHIECEWPQSRPLIDEIYADVPEADRRRIWADNAVEFFRLNAN
jgi:uncharacterized protein